MKGPALTWSKSRSLSLFNSTQCNAMQCNAMQCNAMQQIFIFKKKEDDGTVGTIVD